MQNLSTPPANGGIKEKCMYHDANGVIRTERGTLSMDMKSKSKTEKVKLVNFPEEITPEGIKIYGETSYENQMAVLSHFLHNHQEEVDAVV